MGKATSKQVWDALKGVIEIPKNARKLTVCVDVEGGVVANVEYFPSSVLPSDLIVFDRTTVSTAVTTGEITSTWGILEDDIPPAAAVVAK